jgi:hypothetical protein
LAARITRSAISPRLAIKILSNIEASSPITGNDCHAPLIGGHSMIISG